MKTNEEIIERINELKDDDFFGFDTADLIIRLPFDLAKQYLKPEAKEEEWTQRSKDNEDIKKEMREYMSFAWGKANNCRGISAGRSMAHYTAWVWLCGDDLGDLNDYEYYGKDNLISICEHYGWDHARWDDTRRVNTG